MFQINKGNHTSYFTWKRRCNQLDMPQSEQYCYSCPITFLLKMMSRCL